MGNHWRWQLQILLNDTQTSQLNHIVLKEHQGKEKMTSIMKELKNTQKQ